MNETPSWSFDLHKMYVLNANRISGHWANSDEEKAIIRNLGATHLRQKQLGRFERVHITAEVSYPSRRIQDVMNLYPTMKAYVDGLVNGPTAYTAVVGRNGKITKRIAPAQKDVGILPDDNDLFVVGPHLHWSGKRSTRPDHFQFRITLTPLEPLIPDRDALAPSLAALYLPAPETEVFEQPALL